MIGLKSNNFAVDNQYFSFYEQTGWIDLIYFAVLFVSLAVALVRKKNMLPSLDEFRLQQVALHYWLELQLQVLQLMYLKYFLPMCSYGLLLVRLLYSLVMNMISHRKRGEHSEDFAYWGIRCWWYGNLSQ